MFRYMFFATLFLAASVSHGQAEEKFHGFTINGEVINPMCLQNMHPWYSDGDIIIKSLNLDYCQNSNWAFAANPIKVEGDVVSTKVQGAVMSEVTSDSFSYKPIGKTTDGLFIVMLPDNGEIAAYRIDERIVKDDLFGTKTSKVHILTAIGQSWFRCLNNAWMKGNKVVIERRIPHEDKPRSEECDTKMETVEYEIHQ
ncbi:MAG: hypothetical protein JWM58_4337 [Rhizobium sp.]|nr:hypothetical protein [Rhizobium sp.]